MKPALVSFNAFASVWFFPASMLAFIRNDSPSGSALLILAVASFTYAYRALTGRDVRRHS